MLLYSFTVKSKANSESAICLVWVNQSEPDDAESLARETVDRSGWVVVSLDDVSQTTKDDYFAPCPSLDAFNLASREGSASRVVAL